MTLNRRMLLRVIGAAGAAPIASKVELVSAPVPTAAALPPLPLKDLILKILRPHSCDEANMRVELLSPTIYRLVEEEAGHWRMINGVGQYVRETVETIGHVRAAVYGENPVLSMLGDPLGRGKVIDKWLKDEYYSGYNAVHFLEGFDAIGAALMEDGRLADSLKFKHAARATRAFHKIMGEYDEIRTSGTFSPALNKLINDHNQFEHWGTVKLDELPGRLLGTARSYKNLTVKLAAYKPRKRDKQWWDRFYEEYRRVRSQMACSHKWDEHRWLRDIQTDQRRCWRWTAQYKRRRFAFFSRELTMRKEIRDKVLAALIEHASAPIIAQGQYSNIGVETCLRVIRRLDMLTAVPMEAITMPPNIDPIDVASNMLGNYMRKLFLKEKA